MSCWFWHNWKLINSSQCTIKGTMLCKFDYTEDGFTKLMKCNDCGEEKAVFEDCSGYEKPISLLMVKEQLKIQARKFNSQAPVDDFLTYLEKNK